MDEFKLQGAMDNIMKNSCLPETANELAGNTPHLDDKSQDTGKGRGGDVVCLRQQQLVYWHKGYKTITAPQASKCVTVKYRPIDLPRKFSVVMKTTAYTPTDANANLAPGHSQDTITSQHNVCTEAPHSAPPCLRQG